MFPYNCKFKVTSPYGNRDWGNGVVEFHKGIDLVGTISGKDAKYICAVVGGTVGASQMVTDHSNATWQWGNYVRIDGDDGRKYFYCHMSQRLVNAGERVEAGDHIGIEGNTGYSTGSHCHFEVREGSDSIDPSAILGIPNAVGIYGVDYAEAFRQRAGLESTTINELYGVLTYPYTFFRKLAVMK